VFFLASLVLAWFMLRGEPVRELGAPPVVPASAIAAVRNATLPDPEGKPQSLAQWHDRILVINYWATWCAPCREEMPELSRLQERYGTHGVQIVGIAIDDAGKVRDHLRTAPVSYPVLVGDNIFAETSRSLGNAPMGMPYTVVIDREGKLRATALGRVHERVLAKLLDSLI
jgi:thiol-disulfide isomerase/thioredoxin